jgi:hypothetical protein
MSIRAMRSEAIWGCQMVRQAFYRCTSPIDHPIGVSLIDVPLVNVLLTGAIS